MKKLFSSLIFTLLALILFSQQRIDGTFAFQNDPAKKYSIFIPANYDPNTPNPVMLGLHPLNTSRWNAKSWCDTLSTFAKDVDLIVICPDGGADGRIDDPIDTAFTTFLLDTMFKLYNVDENAVYVMGFSWGGRTTFTYGLRRADKFAGFMPIGPAINGTSLFNDVLPNAKNKPFFYINGSNDSPNNRFYPVVAALKDNLACVEDTLLAGVGHTIDFPGHVALFTMGYNWLKEVNCGLTNVKESIHKETLIWPNPLYSFNNLIVDSNEPIKEIVIFNSAGENLGRIDSISDSQKSGIYFARLEFMSGEISFHKLILIK